ncbi:hypothetical protein ACFSC6_12520 [Rufibacter sediminis]|uniref:Uncharacterized protein n=1 Tax=Rufibacter sediminis TaxID=2762756 RepID=A0ABR6VU25_9BACT|nr:hypothetical protein [Rufibacter sediminis]MBC3540706.1 hypothetical protein [Rufibacter sediminis]
MFIALCILLIIALFITVYYVRANKASATPEGTATRISGGGPNQPATPGQTSRSSYNPGSIPDSAGNGNSAMSSGHQG